MTLHRLPNGCWLDLQKIEVIEVMEGIQTHEDKTYHVLPHVAITIYGHRGQVTIKFDTFNDACTCADELGYMVNEMNFDVS